MKRVLRGILAALGGIVGSIFLLFILALNVAFALFFFWMVFGGGCEYVAGGCQAPSPPSL